MNRIQREKFRDRHLRQKYDLLHMMPTLKTPALSGMYLTNYYNGVKRYDLTLPKEITEANAKFCGKCGSVHVPLLNTQISITDSSAANQETITFKCLNCEHEANFSSHKIKQRAPQVQVENKEVAETTPKKKITKSTAKDRQKKRKQNSLSNLLSTKKKERKSSPSPLASLTLENFMKK
ncbi:Snm1 protein [Maudiozyma humilis]|uniref:Snm1 protein n=1 Tax=Maudiozyma humilis TaxID=51915 RepID=A0AAV5RTS1_MAUHU|nr:Snm1 protein [Kazachstania humilis]